MAKLGHTITLRVGPRGQLQPKGYVDLHAKKGIDYYEVNLLWVLQVIDPPIFVQGPFEELRR
jgi:hypothetical protein